MENLENSLIDELEGRILDPLVENEVKVADVYHLLPVVSKAYIALLTRQKNVLHIARAISAIALNDHEESDLMKVNKWAMNVAQKIIENPGGTVMFLSIIEDFGINPEILGAYLSSPVYTGEKEDHAVILGLKKPFSPRAVYSYWAREFENLLLEEVQLQQKFLGDVLLVLQYGTNLNSLLDRFVSEIQRRYYNSLLWNKVGSEFGSIFVKMLHDRTFLTLNNILKREGESPLFWFSNQKNLWYIRKEHYKEVAEKAPRLLKFHKDYLEKFKK